MSLQKDRQERLVGTELTFRKERKKKIICGRDKSNDTVVTRPLTVSWSGKHKKQEEEAKQTKELQDKKQGPGTEDSIAIHHLPTLLCPKVIEIFFSFGIAYS